MDDSDAEPPRTAGSVLVPAVGGRAASADGLRLVLEAACAWAAALVLYAALRSPVYYKTDGPYLVYNLIHGLDHPYNVGYMPLLRLTHGTVGAWFDWTPFESAGWLSAIGGAFGVAIAHVAFRRLLASGSTAWFATLWFAICPPVAFFSTVVEHHGPFLPFAMAAFALAVEARRIASIPGLVVVGLLTGLVTHAAFLVHGTGNMLPGLVLPVACLGWIGPRDGWRGLQAWTRSGVLRVAAYAVPVAVVHLGAWRFAPMLLPSIYGFAGDASSSLGQLAEGLGRPQSPDYLPEIFVQEFAAPFLPLVAAAALGCVVGGSVPRRLASGVLIALVPYLAVCLLLLVGEPEFGAYLLPFAWPLALIGAVGSAAMGRVGRWILAGVVAVWAVLGFVERATSTAALGRELEQPLSAALQRAVEADPGWSGPPRGLTLLVEGTQQIAFATSRHGRSRVWVPDALFGLPVEQIEAHAPMIRTFVDGALRRGGRVVWTRRLMDRVAGQDPGTAAALVRLLEANYTVTQQDWDRPWGLLWIAPR